jgi:thiol-disulfide isomerase/thioredoxin
MKKMRRVNNIVIQKNILSIALLCMSLFSCKPAPVNVDLGPAEEDLVTWEECGYSIGDHICNFSLVDQGGENYRLYDHVGSPFIVDLSTMWCGYCQVAAQEVDAVTDKYSQHSLIYATILIEDYTGQPPDVSDLDQWAAAFEIVNNPVLAGDRSLVESDSNPGFPVQGWPTFIFIDSEFVIRDIMIGFSSTSLDQRIQLIVSES